MSAVKKKELKQFFLWSPSLDTGMAALSQITITILTFIGLKVFGKTILNPVLLGLMGTSELELFQLIKLNKRI